MEDQKKLLQFVTWLGENVPELKGQTPEQVVSTINKLSESPEGQEMLQGLIKEFESSMTGVFKKGGKLDYLLCLKKGGSIQDCGCGKKIDKKQPGGSIASRLWNKWTGKDTYTDGYGTTRSHVPVKESAHRTALKAADSPLVQAIPVVGDIADGYVAADYAAKGDYKPAMASIGAGLILPNAMEVGARMIPSSTYRNVANKVDDAIEILDVEDNLGRKYVQKNGKWVPENTGEIEVLGVEKPSKWNRTSDKRFNAVEDNSNRWIPETQYDDDLNVIAGSLDDPMSSEPWWGWDPVEYQQGGRVLGSEQYPHATRRDALNAAMEGMGFSRAQARLAYKNQKNALRNAGFSGKELLQNARYNIIDTAYPRAQAPTTPQIPALSTDIEIEEDPIVINDNPFTNLNSSMPTVQKIDRFGGSFDSAFGAARRSGLDKFYWTDPTGKNSGWKTTELDTTKPTSTQDPAQDGLQIVESSGSTAPMVMATPVDDGKGGQRYRFRDLFKMAVINGAANMK